MPLHLEWSDIVLRLALTFGACALVGINREEWGSPAGLRTTILVGLAAALAMLEANLLLDTGGKKPGSFVVLDLMRFPLGILDGMGFIGAGTILRRGNLVRGVTTAATLWFVTVMGLCFGGGQNGLGLSALVLALIVLWGLKWAERKLSQEQYSAVELTIEAQGPTDEEIRSRLLGAGLKICSWAITYIGRPQRRRLHCTVRWRVRPDSESSPSVVRELAAHPQISKLQWKPQSSGRH